MLGLVPLTRGAGAYEVLDDGAEAGGMDVAAESMKGALDTFMAVVVDGGDDLVEEWGAGRDVEAPLVRDQAVDEGPRRLAAIREDLVLERDQGGVLGVGQLQPVDEIEVGGGQRHGDGCRGVGVTARQSVGHGVGAAGTVLLGSRTQAIFPPSGAAGWLPASGPANI